MKCDLIFWFKWMNDVWMQLQLKLDFSVFCITRKHLYLFLYLYLFHQLNDLFLYLYSNWVGLKPDSG